MRRRGARPVRRAARGNGLVETPAPRPGPTPTTSTSACRSTSCACWCSSGSALTAARSSSRWPTATGSRPSPGRTCCATAARRGMRAPVLAVGDGALGFWGALREVFPPDPGAALLVPQDRQRARRAPEIGAPGSEEGPGRDLERRGPPPRPRRRDQASRPPTGRSSPRRVAKITDDVDELLAFYDYPAKHWHPPADHEPHREHVRHRPAPHQDHPRPGLTRRRAGDGVQADRGRPGPLARGQRPAPCRPRPRRRDVRERQTRRTTRRDTSTRSRLKDLHPQVLTIAPQRPYPTCGHRPASELRGVASWTLMTARKAAVLTGASTCNDSREDRPTGRRQPHHATWVRTNTARRELRPPRHPRCAGAAAARVLDPCRPGPQAPDRRVGGADRAP